MKKRRAENVDRILVTNTKQPFDRIFPKVPSGKPLPIWRLSGKLGKKDTVIIENYNGVYRTECVLGDLIKMFPDEFPPGYGSNPSTVLVFEDGKSIESVGESITKNITPNRLAKYRAKFEALTSTTENKEIPTPNIKCSYTKRPVVTSIMKSSKTSLKSDVVATKKIDSINEWLN